MCRVRRLAAWGLDPSVQHAKLASSMESGLPIISYMSEILRQVDVAPLEHGLVYSLDIVNLDWFPMRHANEA